MKLRFSQPRVRRCRLRSGKLRSFSLTVVLVGLSGCQWFDTLLGKPDQPNAADRFIWRVEGHTNAGVPWHDDSSVYFLGRDHELTAVGRIAGNIRWSVRLPVTRSRTIGFGGTAVRGTLYVGDADLFAIDPGDGRVLWRFAPDDGVDVGRWLPMTWGTMLFTGSSNGWVFAVDANSGSLRWSKRLGSATQLLVYPSPVVEGILFVTTVDFESAQNGEPIGGIAALDAATGEVLWVREIPHHVDPKSPTATLAPVATGGVVVAGSRDGPVYAFERTTGVTRWKMEPFPFPQISDPKLIRDIHWLAACDGIVFVGSTSTHVAALDANSGRELWRTAVSTATADGLRCEYGSVFVMRPLGGVEALDVATGVRRWEIGYPNNDFWVGVASDGERVYGGGLAGIYALRND